MPGRMEGWSWAGQGEAMEGLEPTSCRLDLGQGRGREKAGLGRPAESRVPPGSWSRTEACPPARGSPSLSLPPWEGDSVGAVCPASATVGRARGPAVSHGLQRNGLLAGPWASQRTARPPAPRPGVGVGPAWLWLQDLSWHQTGTAAGARGSRPPPARGSRRGPPAAHPSVWPAPSG